MQNPGSLATSEFGIRDENMLKILAWLTGSMPLVSAEEAEWQWACFEWLLRGTGGYGRFRQVSIILPDDRFFPQKGLRSPALESALFEQIKIHAGMRHWPCLLRIQPLDPNPKVAPTVIIKDAPRSALGTFQRGSAEAIITYHPELIRDPMAFVATMAHELGHYLVSEIAGPPPGGSEALEFATDMAAVFLGFGAFLVNSAFSFSQFQNHETVGWSARRQGYLSESQLLNALAIFTVLLGSEVSAVSREIKSHYRALYKRACKRAAQSQARLELLRSIEPSGAETKDIPNPSFASSVAHEPVSVG
jgi:hypothetical protein